jgi:hypothetical protein
MDAQDTRELVNQREFRLEPVLDSRQFLLANAGEASYLGL